MAYLISMLMKVEQRNGHPLPFFLFTLDLIGSLCEGETDVKPERVSLLNDYKVLLEFPVDTVVARLPRSLCSCDVWYGQFVEINCTMIQRSKTIFPSQHLSHRRPIDQVMDSQPELNI